MNIKFKIALFYIIFANFLFAQDLDQINEENIEIIKNDNTDLIENYLQNWKFKRFFLDPFSIFVLLKRLNYVLTKDESSARQTGFLIASFLSIYPFLKRIKGVKNSEISSGKIYATFNFLFSFSTVLRMFNFFKKELIKEDLLSTGIYSIYFFNNFLELYLREINLERAFKK